MHIIFQSNLAGVSQVADGEILLIPANEAERDRRDMAAMVFSQGPSAFRRGAGPIERIIVSCDTTRPALDDMLAAQFIETLESGNALGASAGAFAKYVALAREGLQPGDMPLESSIEGIFLAIRSSAGHDLGNPVIAARFLSDWQRMARIIMAAIEAGKDPFVTDLFSNSSEFARERAFLRNDESVYREDVRRGSQWLVNMPGGPPTSAMLRLDEPKSLLWKYWSRKDSASPVGGSYLLLAVHFGAGNWVISTDPVQRLPIKELAEKLQAAEVQNQSSAAADPWFDGAPFGYTLVASPKAGSKLSDVAIFAIIKKWTAARAPVDRRAAAARHAVQLSIGAVITLVVTVLASILTIHLNRTAAASGGQQAQDSDPSAVVLARGSVLSTTQIRDLTSDGIHVPSFAVIVGVGAAQGDLPDLPASCRNARLFYKLLVDYYGFDAKNIILLTDVPKNPNDPTDPDIASDGMPTKTNMEKAIEKIGTITNQYGVDPHGNPYQTNFVFFYGGHGDPRSVIHDSKIGYLVLSGYKPTDADDTGFDMGYLVKYVKDRIASPHQILLVDCCYSGLVLNTRGRDSSNKSAIYEMWKDKARAVITAGTGNQQSLEIGKRAIFTGNLITALTPQSGGYALADENKDGVVSDQELADYLEHVVAADARQLPGNHQLTPQYLRALPDSDDGVGQFLFIPRNLP